MCDLIKCQTVPSCISGVTINNYSSLMGVGRQFRMAGHLLDRADSSMCNKHHEVGLVASSELEENLIIGIRVFNLGPGNDKGFLFDR